MVDAPTTPDLGVGSHQAVLAAAIARTAGPIVECGVGHFSTAMVHLLGRGRQILSLETDAEWLGKFAHLKSANHRMELVPFLGHHEAIAEWERIGREMEPTQDGVIFLDQSPGEARVPMAKAIKGKFKYLVAHDTEADIPPGGGNYMWRRLNGVFRFEVVYKDVRTWTTVYSDEEEFAL